MSLEFLRKKRFQRRHPDVVCQRMALTIPCVSSLRLTPHQVLQSYHCSLQLVSNPLALPVVKGSQRLCKRRQASSPSPDPEPTRMSNRFSFHKGHQHCIQLICQHSQSVQRHHNLSCCVRFCHRCRFSCHGPCQDVSRSRVYAHNEVLCASCSRHEFAFRVLQWWRLSQTFRVHQGWTGSCWICCG